MISGKNPIERRKHKRFKVQYGAFAVFQSNVKKLGQIIDISRGGLAFRYLANGERFKGSDELDILLADNYFHLEKIPFRTISDFGIASEIPYNSITTRRCGVRFGELGQGQISRIEYFIHNYTIAEA
jgi:hypothetical protein